MRIVSALKADIRFQLKQGFYTVYVFLTLFYLIILGRLNENISSIAVPLVIFSDPSVLGFFFVGGMVMLEKVQGIQIYLTVTPLRVKEYLIAKVVSLSLVSIFAGIIIALTNYKGQINWILLLFGIFLTSVFFTLYGFIIALGCRTLNEYFLKMVPYMILVTLPCITLLNFDYSWLLSVFPSGAGIRLVYGAFHGISTYESIIFITYLIVVNYLLLNLAEKTFNKKMNSGGNF